VSCAKLGYDARGLTQKAAKGFEDFSAWQRGVDLGNLTVSRGREIRSMNEMIVV